MKYKILLIVILAAAVTSCSTYKAGQTPDDVYYSPAREAATHKEARNDERVNRYDEYVSSSDDRYLRMKIQNRDRWSSIDDYSYWYDTRYNYFNNYNYNNYYSPYSYTFGYNNPFNYNYYNPYNTWNSFGYNIWWSRPLYFGYGGYYSPSYPVIYYKSPRVYTTTTGRPNLNTYSNKSYNNSNNSKQSFGEVMRRVFSTENNSYNNSNYGSRGTTTNSGTNSYSAPTRSYNPPASSSSSSSSGSSGGGGVSRPGRSN